MIATPERPHVHCYSTYPESLDFCLSRSEASWLSPGDEIVRGDGVIYAALPTLASGCLEVEIDRLGAQVATIVRLEPNREEVSRGQLVGAGVGPIDAESWE